MPQFRLNYIVSLGGVGRDSNKVYRKFPKEKKKDLQSICYNSGVTDPLS